MKPRLILTCVCIAILLAMTVVSVFASLDRNIFAAGNLFKDPWFVATICDAYCGFLLFYCWVFYKERSSFSRAAWFVAIMLLGNFAMAIYLLRQIYRRGVPRAADSEFSEVESVLLRGG